MNQISSTGKGGDEDGSDRGYIQVYTGNGKGKTSAGVGQLLRALGHGLTPYVITFFKGGDEYERGIAEMMRSLDVPIVNFAPNHPSFGSTDEKSASLNCGRAIQFLSELFTSEESYDLILLDEINVALRDGFLETGDFLAALKERPSGIEIIMTGRGAPEEVVEEADIVSNIQKVKHVFDLGVSPRAGFDY